VTVAMPLLCLPTASEQAYFTRKDEILATLAQHFHAAPFQIDWQLNCLDRRGRGTEGSTCR